MYLQKKNDVATYREKAPHLSYSEKVDLIKNVFVPEKTFAFQKQLNLLNMSGYCCFPSEDASYCLSCVLFGHDFPTKASRVKNLFSQPFRAWPSAVSYFKAHLKAKRRKLILHMNLFKAFIFQQGLTLKLFFLKSKAQAMKLICYVIENINMWLKKIVKY